MFFNKYKYFHEASRVLLWLFCRSFIVWRACIAESRNFNPRFTPLGSRSVFCLKHFSTKCISLYINIFEGFLLPKTEKTGNFRSNWISRHFIRARTQSSCIKCEENFYWNVQVRMGRDPAEETDESIPEQCESSLLLYLALCFHNVDLLGILNVKGLIKAQIFQPETCKIRPWILPTSWFFQGNKMNEKTERKT